MAAKIVASGPQPESETALWACLSRFVNHRDGSPIHPTTIAVNAGIFFEAGYETTAHSTAWALFELAARTDVQVCFVPEAEEEELSIKPLPMITSTHMERKPSNLSTYPLAFYAIDPHEGQ